VLFCVDYTGLSNQSHVIGGSDIIERGGRMVPKRTFCGQNCDIYIAGSSCWKVIEQHMRRTALRFDHRSAAGQTPSLTSFRGAVAPGAPLIYVCVHRESARHLGTFKMRCCESRRDARPLSSRTRGRKEALGSDSGARS
jgi:hypothetical protein